MSPILANTWDNHFQVLTHNKNVNNNVKESSMAKNISEGMKDLIQVIVYDK